MIEEDFRQLKPVFGEGMDLLWSSYLLDGADGKKEIEEILPLLKNKAAEKENGKLKQCQECGEPATKNICNACKIAEELKCTVIQD